MRSTGKRVLLCVQLDAVALRLDKSPYSQTAIGASNCYPRPASPSQFGITFSRPLCLAAHVLRNDTIRLALRHKDNLSALGTNP
jgi:hypothetical protein